MSARRPQVDTPADLVLYALRCTRPDSYRAHPAGPHAWAAYCPVCLGHGGRTRTLTVSESGRGGPVTLRCASGCERETIMASLGAAVRYHQSGQQRTAS